MGLRVEEVAQLNHFATDGLSPARRLYLDVPMKLDWKRIHKARGNRQFDRLGSRRIKLPYDGSQWIFRAVEISRKNWD